MPLATTPLVKLLGPHLALVATLALAGAVLVGASGASVELILRPAAPALALNASVAALRLHVWCVGRR